MSSEQFSVHAFVCLSLLSSGCAPDALAFEGACDGVTPGHLVITEVHANPDGADGAGEYVELFNPGMEALTLDAFALRSSRADGTGAKSRRLVGAAVEARDFVVLGNAPAAAMPPHLDFSYGDALGNLRNSDGALSIWCGEILVDGMSYERTSDGRAIELDGRLEPSHAANDDAEAWCSAGDDADLLATGGLGSPGRANGPCDPVEDRTGCAESGVWRAIDSPSVGDLRIEEWMANPEGLDAELEWVELLISRELDLNGLQLGPSPDELSLAVDADACFPVDAGAHVVFGASPAAAPRVDAELPFSLRNSGERSIVAAIGGVVLDRVDYSETFEGVSWQRDDEGAICLASEGASPGEPNLSCQPVLAEGMCLDAGVPRNIARPLAGRAQISEWMASPNAVDDRAGEWVEVLFLDAVDLNGITLSDRAGSSTTIDAEVCRPVAAGSHIVWARNLDPALNGGVGPVAEELGISLNNRDEDIVLSVDGVLLDAVSYTSSEPGVATQVDSLGLSCAASSSYGDGDLGTPGQPNPPCD